MIAWWWLLVELAIVLFACWLMRDVARTHPYGGYIDHTPAAARGELDFDWDDPRHPQSEMGIAQAKGWGTQC